jgi:site-specific DNA recombinase
MKNPVKREIPVPTKSVGIWIRVSTEDQARGESPEHHEKRAKYYAESKGWNVREVYHLEGISGKSVMGQPETERMLRHIRSAHISGLIFSKLARFARNTRELLELSDIFREYDADLISLQEAIDTSTPAGRLFFTIIAAMAQWEREEIAERVAASVPIRAKLGKSVGGQAPFGYQWHERKLLPHPDEAPIRKRMYELFLEHRRKKAVARLLNEAGYRTRNGSKFSDTTVDRLIRDPMAKGLRRANYTKSLGNKKHWRMKPEEDWVFSEVEPIVSEELWEQCNLILNERRNGRRPTRRAVHLFSGLAFCDCGQKMYVPSSNPKYTCCKCHNKIGLEDLEGVFHEELKSFFFSPTEWLKYLEQADTTIKEKQELLESLDKERQKISQDMEKVYRLYMSDQITPEGFGRQNRPLEERQKQLEEEIPRLQGEIDFLKINYLSSDQILTNARDLYTRWPDLQSEEKRRVVENITEKIVIGKSDVTIELCYLPSPSEIASTEQRNLTGSWPQRA